MIVSDGSVVVKVVIAGDPIIVSGRRQGIVGNHHQQRVDAASDEWAAQGSAYGDRASSMQVSCINYDTTLSKCQGRQREFKPK